MCMHMHMYMLLCEISQRTHSLHGGPHVTREPRGGAADVPQRLSTLLGSTHTDMKRTRGPMAVHEQQRERR